MSIPDNAIAVVGMAGRFPGANDLSAFWSNLRRGKESIVTLSEQELRDEGVSEQALAASSYVRRAPLLDGIDEFDAGFFGLPPQAAQVLDPQHRLFLQCAWHALEDAGCDPARFDGSIGVYGTSSPSGYLLHNLMSHRDPNSVMAEGLNFDQFSLFLQNDKDFLTTRISHQFDLRGPSLAVQTACSSSLVAVHLACLSLLSGECDMALAGGVSLCVPNHVGYWHSPGQMLSAVGHCRPFDVRADGTVFGSGVGLVVLKPLQAALDNGDRIHAVIRGSAINNDGSAKMGFAAPSASAQADCIAEAHAVSDVDASTISYVETHGTGTPLGDPIEIQGLRTAFEVSEEPRPGPCVIGSVKSNIGHLEVAAGIAALIKTILCLKNKAIPATLHYTSANPELHLDETPFTVQSRYGAWESEGLRRAGVSSFGIGGTNAHVVLEEAPEVPPTPSGQAGPQVLLLSARTAEALTEARTALAGTLERPNAPDIVDVAHTLAGRRKHGVTMAAVVGDRAEAISLLRAAEHDNVFVGASASDGEASKAEGRVVFLFPGQGAQHVGMAKGLYDSEPVFAEHFDACAKAFQAESGLDLPDLIFGDSGSTATDLERIDRSQPALFTVEYALAKLVESYGVRADAYVGYSTGEYIAATLAGVFDLQTAVKTVALRARLMHEAPPGAMVAVALSPADLAQHLVDGVELSAVNDPGNCVVAGPKNAIRAFTQRLSEHGVAVRRVRATHAFHTSAMDGMLGEFEKFLSGQQLKAPNTRLLSNLTGSWLSDEQATDPATWIRQISSTIRFADELDAVLTDPRRILVEVGPGGSLTGSAIRHPRWSSGHRCVRLMRHPMQQADDRDTFLRALGELWSAGVDVDWAPLHPGHPARIVSVPGYPFERQRHWIEPKVTTREHGTAASNGSAVYAHPQGASAAEAESQTATQTGATLQRVWEQCLGVRPIDPGANFFDLGGDSLMAISIAMAAANEGLSITPQDLYEHPTLAALTAAVDAAFAASGLAKPPEPDSDPAVLPNTTYFLERGLRDGGRWRVPLILRLASSVSQEDILTVLTAVTKHHEVLRLQLVDNAGVWEQHIAPASEFIGLAVRSLPGDLPDQSAGDSAEERAAVSKILAEVIAEQSDSTAPLTAVHITGTAGGPNYLGLGVHAMVADTASHQILGSDIVIAFGQHLAGQKITLEAAATGWREWSQRSAALATHPAALDTRTFWTENAAKVTRWLTEPDGTPSPTAADLAKLSCSLDYEQTSELDDARRRFRRPIQSILLAALGRTIAQTVGDGVVAIELEGDGRSVLRPDVDLRRTVGWCTTYYPVALACAGGEGTAVVKQLDAVNDTLKAVPHYGIGYGLLRYVYAPTGRTFGAQRTPDIHFRYAGAIPELPPVDAPVAFDSDVTMPIRDTIPGLGHAIEIRIYRFAGSTQVDWWYDKRRVSAATMEALSQTFPSALSELIREGQEGLAEVQSELAGVHEAGALVDLSSLD